MLWEIIVGVITLVLGLVAIWFAFGVKKRSEGCVAKNWGFLLSAIVVFSISKVIEVLDEAGIISVPWLEGALHILISVLLVIGFWGMLKCIREVDGELEVDGKFKVVQR